MKKELLFCTIFIIIVSSCVSKKKYVDLNTKHKILIEERGQIYSELEELQKTTKDIESSIQLDVDGDGIIDSLDICPNEPGTQGNDGCPLADLDGDGVYDDMDICPSEFGTKSNNGCPVEVSAFMPEESNEELAFFQEEFYNSQKKNNELTSAIANSKVMIDSLSSKQIFGKEKGYVVFDCPLIMKEGTQTNVSAVLGKVIDSLKLKIKTLNFSKDENPASTKPLKIRDSKVVDLALKMKIELLENDDFKKMKLINGLEEKEIDLENGTRWKWHVTPNEGTAGKEDMSLSFRITAFDKNGLELLNEFKTIDIEVKVAKSTWQLFVDACHDDIKWPITVMIIPIITFFAGIWRENRKNRKNA